MKVLVVDDDEDFTTMISEFLCGKDIENFVVNDPLRGIDEIKSGRYDVVLLDNYMPGFNGIEIIRKLKNEKILGRQKIILFSGFDFTGQEIDELIERNGIEKILRKPTPLKELLGAIIN